MKIILLFFVCLLGSSYAQKFGSCYTPDEYKGGCVYLTSCPPLHQLTQQKPMNPKHAYFLSLSVCGRRDDQMLVCCKNDEIVENHQTVTEQAEQSFTTQSPVHKNLLPMPGQCGIDFQDRIYGGNVTNIDEYPWTAMIGYARGNNRVGYHCGGVLINTRYVLTAGHCVQGKNIPPLVHVRLGEWDVDTNDDCDDSYSTGKICSTPPINVPIEEIIPHPNYDAFATNQHNDIAILRLSQEVTYNDYIYPICMPIIQSLRDDKLVGKTNAVAGWGKTETRQTSNIKLKVNVNVMSNEDCNEIYKIQNREIIDSQICAGGKKGEDSCRGDSGGPLMRQNYRGNPPYWYLTGLVSYGPTPCGKEGWPGVYTRVGNYVDWIIQNMRP